MTLRFLCGRRDCRAWTRVPLRVTGRHTARCQRCDGETAIDASIDLVSAGHVVRCPCCDGSEFFIRKDFPQRLGLALVIVFGLASAGLFWQRQVPAAFGTMAALVVIDALLCLFVGRVTVCYRCRAELRGVAYNPDHKAFDLATSEKYG